MSFERDSFNLFTAPVGSTLVVLAPALGLVALSLASKTVLNSTIIHALATVCAVPLGAFALLYVRRRIRFYLPGLPGPACPSFLVGSELDYFSPEAGKTSMAWIKQYGPVLKYSAAFGGERLIVSDPKALEHITMSAAHNYDRPKFGRDLVKRMVGPGIVWAVGDTHQRHRKIIAPRYNGKYLGEAADIFTTHAHKVADKWARRFEESGETALPFNLYLEVTSAALDVLFKFSFDVDLGTIENPDHDLAKAFRWLFIGAFSAPTAWSTIVREILQITPKPILPWLEMITPSPQVQSTLTSFKMADDLARGMVRDRMQALKDEEPNQQPKDLLSALLKSHLDNDPSKNLPLPELLGQIATMAAAGQETTGSTIAFLFWELCNFPVWQDRLREEVREHRSRKGGADFTMHDYEKMTFLQAVIKETYRFHPVCQKIDRAPTQDDVIPLLDPVVLKNGQPVQEVRIAAGVLIQLDIASYNRDKRFFGDDADSFNPERWLPGSTKLDGQKNQTLPGVVGNTFTFIDGPRSCPGWRFATLEIATMTSALIENHAFEIEEGHNIIRGFGGVMGPICDNDWSGWNLPVRVRQVS